MAVNLKMYYEELGRAFHSKPCNVTKCVALLPKLKVRLAQLLLSFTQ